MHKPLCCEVPSFIRDDLEFLNHLPTTVNPNSELISFDVVSLYTNSSVSWRHFISHCGSSFLSVKLTVKIENISFKNNFHGFKNKFFRLYEQLLNSYGQEFASYVRQSWKRFLDDCFIIWNSDIPVEIFHTELNSLNDHIRFPPDIVDFSNII
jgi:hypothetical protein